MDEKLSNNIHWFYRYVVLKVQSILTKSSKYINKSSKYIIKSSMDEKLSNNTPCFYRYSTQSLISVFFFCFWLCLFWFFLQISPCSKISIGWSGCLSRCPISDKITRTRCSKYINMYHITLFKVPYPLFKVPHHPYQSTTPPSSKYHTPSTKYHTTLFKVTCTRCSKYTK